MRSADAQMEWHACCNGLHCERRVSRSHGAGSVANLHEAMPPTRTHLLGAYRWRFFFGLSKRGRCRQAIRGKDDEASYRIVAQRKLEGFARVFFILRYGIYGLGDVRAARAVYLQAVVAITDSGRVFSRCARA